MPSEREKISALSQSLSDAIEEAECLREWKAGAMKILRQFTFGDADIADILWGDQPDSAPMKVTLPFGVYRAARKLVGGRDAE